jgi:hypothetical protein
MPNTAIPAVWFSRDKKETKKRRERRWMMLNKFGFRWSLMVVACVVAIATVAMADVAPPDDYIETCTLEQQHHDDFECLECRMSYLVDQNDEEGMEGYCDPDALSDDGYEQKCRTWGGSVWDEIWCRPSPGTDGPADDPVVKCSVVAVGKEKREQANMTLLSILFGLF